MCEMCGNLSLNHAGRDLNRRRLILGGAAVAAAAPFVAVSASDAVAQSAPAAAMGQSKVRAFAASTATGKFAQTEIARRAVGANDIKIDILFAGICHSDIHTVRGDWGKPNYPTVPGHEIIGRVVAVGDKVTKFKVGDFAGVGCMVASCGECENCLNDREQNCLKGTTFTYDSADKVSGGVTYGGYSDAIVVTEKFGIRIPPGVDLAAFTPLLCAGITTYSPMQHWKLGRGQKVGVVGLGGLGHMAVKLAVARGAEVTVFTTSPGKIDDARRLGAKNAVLLTDGDAVSGLAGTLDLAISTAPESYSMMPVINALKLDGTLINVGALGQLESINGMMMAFGRKSFAGSLIGGIAETQEVIDYCAARNITADIELIAPDQIDRAWDRVMAKDVRYRFVIDMTKGRKA